jgi:rhodanese-related sulfurtransferase
MRVSFSLAAAAIAGFALVLGVSGASAQQVDLSAVDPTVDAASHPAPQTVAPDAVLKMLESKDPSVAIVDTQPVEGYADGHLPGAINYPWVMRISKFPVPLPRNKTLVFYGSCPNDTGDIIKQLAEYGYFNVKVMDGGWYKWQALKYPAEGKGAYAQSHQPAPPDANSISQQAAAPRAVVAQNSAR